MMVCSDERKLVFPFSNDLINTVEASPHHYDIDPKCFVYIPYLIVYESC